MGLVYCYRELSNVFALWKNFSMICRTAVSLDVRCPQLTPELFVEIYGILGLEFWRWMENGVLCRGDTEE